MSIDYDITFSSDLKVPNTNVKSWDDTRRALEIIMSNFRAFTASVTATVDVGHPHTWTGASYSPSLSCQAWEGSGISPRSPALGSGGSHTGYSWNLFGWTYATGLIHWGTESGRDTGYGKWRVTLPSTPYDKGSRWLGHCVLKQQYTASGTSPVLKDDTIDFTAVCPPGQAYVEFFALHDGAANGTFLGLGGASASANTTSLNLSSQNLARNSLLSWDLWYRTEA